MNALVTWIIKSRHLNPNDFYVKVDGSEFYTAYWIANVHNKDQASLLTLEASEELDLGQVEIQETILYEGQQIANIAEIDTAIKAAVEKYVASDEPQLAAWVSSQGGKW